MSFLKKQKTKKQNQKNTFFIRCRKNRQNPGRRCWGWAVVVVPVGCSCLYLWTRDRAQYSTFEHAMEVSGQNSDYWPILNTQQDLACHSREPIRICSISLPYSSTFICFFFFFLAQEVIDQALLLKYSLCQAGHLPDRKETGFSLQCAPFICLYPPAGTVVQIHFALWASAVPVLASLNLLCSVCRIHSLTCFFCQPVMGMLTKTSSDVRLWDSQIFILKILFYSSSFFSVPAPLRSMTLLHVPLITTTSWTASCEGPRYRFFEKLRYCRPFILCYHFLPTLSKKYSW